MRYPIYRSFYTSYATGNNCTPLGHGSFRWCGLDGNHNTKCETGLSCQDARTTFCNRHGVNGQCITSTSSGSNIQGSGGTDLATDLFLGKPQSSKTIDTSKIDTGSSVSKQVVKNALTDDGCGGKGVNSASGCCNCGSDWDLGTVSCNLFGKPSCELQVYTRNGLKGLLDNSGKFLSDNLLFVAAGIGGILVITLLLTRR